jgi:hypothetical protein
VCTGSKSNGPATMRQCSSYEGIFASGAWSRLWQSQGALSLHSGVRHGACPNWLLPFWTRTCIIRNTLMELTGGCVISSLAEHTHECARCHKSAGAPRRIPISSPPTKADGTFRSFSHLSFSFGCASHPRNFSFDSTHTLSSCAPAVNWNAIFRQQDSQYRTPGLITFLSWVMPLLNFLFPQRRRRQPIFANNIKLDAAARWVRAPSMYACASGAAVWHFYRVACTAVYK